MRRAAIVSLLFLTFCASRGPTQGPAVPGQGAIQIQIAPNPILATRVGGETYDFPFEVVIRETGGRPVTINRVSADVRALGGIRVGSESYDATKIASLGYSTTVAPYGELRYRFNPRRSVGDDRLFGSVSAEIRVEGRDDQGIAATAGTTVTVRRG
ncbi:MAG TPA: hypothetical protein VMS98_04960 [Thermoanaerobaculia bacterium]|nr:hypothetical protein [Thermoanaerobaculia bacterium]